MKIRKLRNRVLLIAAAGTFALGCELIVDFDRTKIPVEGTDAATSDSSIDASIDTSQPDTSVVDSATDAADADTDAADAADAADGD
jgi:hypothetical protein